MVAGCCRYAREIAQLKTKLAEKDAQLLGGFGSLTSLYLGELGPVPAGHPAGLGAAAGLLGPGLDSLSMPAMAAAGQVGSGFNNPLMLQGAGVAGLVGLGSGADASSSLMSAATGPVGLPGGPGGGRLAGGVPLPQPMPGWSAAVHVAGAAAQPQQLMLSGGSRLPSAGASNGTSSRLQPAGAAAPAEPAPRAGSPKLEPLRGSPRGASPRQQQPEDQLRPGSGSRLLQVGAAGQPQQPQVIKPGSPLGPLVGQQQQGRGSYGAEGLYSNGNVAARGNSDIGENNLLDKFTGGGGGGGSASGRSALLHRGSGSLRESDTGAVTAAFGRASAVPERWQQQQQQQDYANMSEQGLGPDDDEGKC